MRDEQPEAASAPQSEALCTALIEQAKLQREAHEDVAQHIAEVTTLVADLGQTVSLLAVAVYDARQVRVPTVSLPPPPRVGGNVDAVATATMTALGVSSAASSPVPAAISPASAAATLGHTSEAANAWTSALAPACPGVSLPIDTGRPSACKPARGSPSAGDALDSARISSDLEDDDDADLAGVVDSEERTGRARLGPVTDLVLGTGAADV